MQNIDSALNFCLPQREGIKKRRHATACNIQLLFKSVKGDLRDEFAALHKDVGFSDYEGAWFCELVIAIFIHDSDESPTG